MTVKELMSKLQFALDHDQIRENDIVTAVLPNERFEFIELTNIAVPTLEVKSNAIFKKATISFTSVVDQKTSCNDCINCAECNEEDGYVDSLLENCCYPDGHCYKHVRGDSAVEIDKLARLVSELEDVVKLYTKE